ncbi:acetyl-CoA synthetase [Dissulfurispira thermophila]|uniref:Acetyl-CoA synthetase n=1 Tax=Dissulfurispira thermophila TaxID=2715679 RepID=A0A7G1H0G1_9BACT|nr:acetate--CoA ligase family protein [Dissulfurispira thermophila]BCB95792.1 acetyl-CoA synthetase [Dissulfurispira thermophila]
MLKEFIEKNRDKKAFLEYEVKGLFKTMGFSVPDGVFIPKDTHLSAFSLQLSALSYPLVAKVSSQKITSKSDVRGIRLGIRNEDELNNAISELMHIENAEGVLVEEMASHGLEVIIGGVIDEQFGPIVMFGLGGVFVEVFKDIAFGLAPLKKDEALWLIRQIKGYRLLEGYRGDLPVDFDALINIIVSVSEMMATNLIKEIDLNPVALYPKGAMILDAKMKIIL